MKKTKVYEIMGKPYNIVYCKNQVDVTDDRDDAGIANGKIRFGPNEIRLYDNKCFADRMHWLLHEVIHGLDDELNIEIDEKRTDLLAVGLADFLIRNGIVEEE